MVSISDLQRRAFSQAAVDDYVRRVTVHLRRFFREHTDHLGPAATESAVRGGIGKAANYGLTTERDVCKFVDLMFALGHDFDTRLPWAARILRNPLAPPTARINRAYDVAVAQLSSDVRPGNASVSVWD